MKISMFMLFASLLLLAGSCGTGKPDARSSVKAVPVDSLYAKAWNQERVKRGITPYYPNLILDQSDSSGASWTNVAYTSAYETTRPIHRYKMIHLNKGDLEFEVDFFLSGKKWSQPTFESGSEFPEYLMITYYYDTTNYNNTTMAGKCCAPWHCVYENSPLEKQITIDEADSILKSWGIDRLHPE